MDEIIEEIDQAHYLSFDRSFQLAQLCSFLLKGDDVNGRKLLINILNNWNKIDPKCHEIWIDLIDASGFYPYLFPKITNLSFKNISGELRLGLHESANLNSKFFHDEQLAVLELLNAEKNVIVSAPTSFGKSLLIEEMVASRKYKNVVIIQPTLALLDETRRKLLKYSEDYKLIVRTSQQPDLNKGNIFLFTAERVNEYNDFPNIEFLVIDEFYKLSGNRDDERSSSLNTAFYHVLKHHHPKFYLLGPHIDGISEGFAEKYNATFFKSDYSLVDSRSINIYSQYPGQFSDRGTKKLFKENVLFNLLLELQNEQTIIYCSSPSRVKYLAKSFTYYLNANEQPKTTIIFPLSEWIRRNVSPDWCLLDFLDYEIGIHDGSLQKHITTSIIDYFNAGKLKYLFCTSTIIEGVNTSAKNIVFFDKNRGGNPIDFFDYANIKGRAGRMMEHFVGRIYNFSATPENAPIIIDIPFFQQAPIKDEVLIQIDRDEVKFSESEQYRILETIPNVEREVIKKNAINVFGQKSIIDIIRRDIDRNFFLIDWVMPDYRQLEYIIGLGWDFLLVPGETTRPMTKKKLINRTFNYGLNQSVGRLIQDCYTYNRNLPSNVNKANNEIMDEAIQEIFQMIKHWFEYKVPKWLSVINEIVKFVCLEKGIRAPNYAYYANLIENDFLRPNLSILAEYGIPSSAIRKMEADIPNDLTEDFVLNYIKERRLFDLPSMIDYEKQKIQENLN
jgi:hypothetical protein